MKKTMVLFGIATSLLVGCSDAETKQEETKQTSKIEEKAKKQEVASVSHEKEEEKKQLELPTLQFNEILLKNADGMKEAFRQAGMTEKKGSFTYGDITIDSIKEKGDEFSFLLTFKDAVSETVKYQAFDSLHIHRMDDEYIQRKMEEKEKEKGKKDTGRVSDNLAYALEVNDKMEKYISWNVVEDKNGKTKQVMFRVWKP